MLKGFVLRYGLGQSTEQSRDDFMHRLIKITDRTLDVIFSRFRGFSFTITPRQKPKGVTRNVEQTLSL